MYISIFNKDFHFHLFFTIHSFSGPFRICLRSSTQRVRQDEGLLQNFLQKNPTSAPACLLRETPFQTQTISVIFNLPGNSSPTHFLKVALLSVLWIYTFLCNFSHTSRDPQTPGKKIIAFYTAHMRRVSTLGALGVTETVRLPVRPAY